MTRGVNAGRPRAAEPARRLSGLAFALAALAAISPASAEDWPRWRGPRGDGSWKAPELPDTLPAGAGLKTVWNIEIGGGYGGIAVVGDRLYVQDRPVRAKPDDPEEERVLCLDARTGGKVWEHRHPAAYGKLDYGNGPRATPTVEGGRVWTLGAVGTACCLDAATGKVIWQRDLRADAGARVPMWGFAASPVLDGPRVLLHVGAEDGTLLALDKDTGKELWRGGPDPAGYCTPMFIDAPSGRQVVIWTPMNVRALDPATGKALWAVPYKVTYGVSIAGPVWHEGRLFVSGYWEGAKMIRPGPAAGDVTVEWEENRHLRGLMSTPLLREGTVYMLDKGSGVTAFRWADGTVLWNDGHKLTARGRNPHVIFVWTGQGDRALALNAEGELIHVRFAPSGLTELWRAKAIDGRVWSHPAFAGSRVYVRADGAEKPTKTCRLACVELPAVRPQGAGNRP